MTDPLKLIALDTEDLSVLSAHMQDAVCQAGDMAYLPTDRRFALIANRFDWSSAVKQPHTDSVGAAGPYYRHRTALRFERVTAAKVSGLDLKDKRRTLSLLALQFDEGTAPAGSITLQFAGGAAVRLDVECIEGELRDLGAAWSASSKPAHPEPDAHAPYSTRHPH